MRLSKAIFLDRDGTLIEDKGYMFRTTDLSLLPGIPEGLRMLQNLGYDLFVATNQSGINRGFFSENQMKVFHDELLRRLKEEKIDIKGIYYCPHRPEENCLCRKPLPGLIQRAQKDHSIDLSKSFTVGDKLTDTLTGLNAGCEGILIGKDEKWNGKSFRSLLQFTRWLHDLR